ncbi:hypothetical protein JCM10908_007113 [Rhodotorula pacifica]|uniref:uncharacterized protein n=1 Tax=Rhodotorula pacifica TaxID=1495444 RepID=UPI0031737158
MTRWKDKQRKDHTPYNQNNRLDAPSGSATHSSAMYNGGQGYTLPSAPQQDESASFNQQQQHAPPPLASTSYIPHHQHQPAPYHQPYPYAPQQQQPFLPAAQGYHNPHFNPAFFPFPHSGPFQPSFPAFYPPGQGQGGYHDPYDSPSVNGQRRNGGLQAGARRGGGNSAAEQQDWHGPGSASGNGLGDHRPAHQTGDEARYHGYRPPHAEEERYASSEGARTRHRSPRQRHQQQQQQQSRSPSPAPYASGSTHHPNEPTPAPGTGGGKSRRPPAHIRRQQQQLSSRPSSASSSSRPSSAAEAEEKEPSYGPDGSYIPPSRRQRRDTRHAEVLPPTATYLAAASQPPSQQEGEEPIALVMDLNHTLLCRAKRNRQASKMPVVRPYLATFLTYICTPSSPSPSSSSRPRLGAKFDPIVYSSARAPNVLSMLAALNLIPPSRLSTLRFKDPYVPLREEGDVLKMVFTREMMGLSERDYSGDVETVKDLGRVWERLGWGQGAAAAPTTDQGDEGVIGDSEFEDKGTVADALDAGSDPEATSTELKEEEKAKKPKLNRKAKARLATRRDTIGAQRTLLLDDEAGKAAQQPYSHLAIAPFLLHPSEIPDRAAVALSPAPAPSSSASSFNPTARTRTSRASSPAGSAPRTPFYDPSAVALEVEPRHPPAHDSHLLSTIWVLERLSTEKNLAYAIKEGVIDKLREEARLAVELRKSGADEDDDVGAEVEEKEIDDEMARYGFEVCEKLGIAVTREWVPEWRERLLETLAEGSTRM